MHRAGDRGLFPGGGLSTSQAPLVHFALTVGFLSLSLSLSLCLFLSLLGLLWEMLVGGANKLLHPLSAVRFTQKRNACTKSWVQE